MGFFDVMTFGKNPSKSMGGLGKGGGGFGGFDLDSIGLGGLGNFGASLGLGGDSELIYGRKPDTPGYSKTVADAIKETTENLPAIQDFTKKANAFTAEQAAQMLSFVDPDWKKNFSLAGDQAERLLSGELFDATTKTISSVAKAFSGGMQNAFKAGGAGANWVMRDLGLEVQEQVRAGLAANERWLDQAARLAGPQFDFTKLFTSPKDLYSQKWQEELIASAPDPVARGQSDAWSSLIGQVLGVYSGGPGYQNTYRPNYGGTDMYGGGGGNGGSSFWYSPPASQDINIYNADYGAGGPGTVYDMGYGGGGGINDFNVGEADYFGGGYR